MIILWTFIGCFYVGYCVLVIDFFVEKLGGGGISLMATFLSCFLPIAIFFQFWGNNV